jgi:hypothetical protein
MQPPIHEGAVEQFSTEQSQRSRLLGEALNSPCLWIPGAEGTVD